METKDMRKCNSCNTLNNNLKRCSNCKEVFYCDITCQKKDRNFHKRICEKKKDRVYIENGCFEYTFINQNDIVSNKNLEEAKKWVMQKQFHALADHLIQRKKKEKECYFFAYVENLKGESNFDAHLQVLPLDTTVLIITRPDGTKVRLDDRYILNMTQVCESSKPNAEKWPLFFVHNDFPHVIAIEVSKHLPFDDKVDEIKFLREFHTQMII